MIKQITNSEKGASLIELLLYFSLLSLVLIIGVDLMLKSGEIFLSSRIEGATQTNASFISNRFRYDILRADSITTPTNLGDTTTSMTLTSGSTTVTYSLVGNSLELEMTAISGTQTAFLNDNEVKINFLSFERIGNVNGKHSIKMSFEIETNRVERGDPKIETFETVVNLR